MLRHTVLAVALLALALPTGVVAEGDSDLPSPAEESRYAAGTASNNALDLVAQQTESRRLPATGGGRTDSARGTGAGAGSQAVSEPEPELAVVNGKLVRLTPWRSKPALTIDECWDGPVERKECRIIPEDDPGEADVAAGGVPSRDRVERTVRSLVSRMELPLPVPLVGPDPSVNEWNMAVVGYPLWLWTDNPESMSSTVTGNGITITMRARRGATTFDMGDGKKVSCSKMTPYPARVKPATPSPTCGYAYGWPSLPQGNYTVTASSRWVVDWSALGFEGSIPVTVSAQRALPVGELHALVVR